MRNMIANNRALLFILPLVFLAGCTGVDGILPGQDVINVAASAQEEGFRDVLVIKDITTIPKSPILAEQPVFLSFIIENRDKEKEATEVIVDLFDAPLFKGKNGPCNSERNNCLPEETACTGSGCVILPGEQKQINFNLKAPNDKEIAGLQTDIDINFRVTYKFEGSTIFKVLVVNMDEIKARQRAGSSIALDARKVFGSGPVKIDAELKGDYILSGLGGTLSFVVKNAGDTGKGSIKNSVVPQADNKLGLNIEFPKDLFLNPTVYKAENPDGSLVVPDISIFGCNDKVDPIICPNTGKELTMFKGESQLLLFRIAKSKPIENIPFRSFDIKAAIDYIYELRDSTKVTVLPLVKVQ